MQKVKVTRYVSGRRPEYAPEDSSSEDSGEEEGGFGVGGEGRRGEGEGEEVEVELGRVEGEPEGGGVREEDWRNDPRLRRLRERRSLAEEGR